MDLPSSAPMFRAGLVRRKRCRDSAQKLVLFFLEACVSDLSFAVLLDDLGCRRIAGFKLLLVEA
jgi:hypothetical protein